MKKIFMIFFMFMVCKSQLLAQHYITFSGGFSLTFYHSEDLNRFKETYNLVYGPSLTTPMKGIGGAEGFRWELGYRHFGRLCTAIQAGMQSYLRRDLAHYANGEERRLEFKMNSMYIEYEMGPTFDNFFVSGVFTVFFNRKISLKSTYSGPMGEVTKKALNGTYESNSSISTDLGIAGGIFRDPVFLITKITYPLFTGGGSTVLQDARIEKVANGTHIFPDDYVAYLYGDAYHGVSSNIDGLKILVTVAFAIPIKK